MLTDEHNATLERLRILGGSASAEALLGDADAQLDLCVDRATPGLAAAAAGGAGLANRGGGRSVDSALVSPIARGLAEELVLPFRRRLLDMLVIDGVERGPDTVDRVNSVYRQWRARVEPAVGDAITAAVAAGFAGSLEPGALVRWIVEDVDGPCPDCDDNALAGMTALGDAFPTGQIAPPAHPGCRCALSQTET